MAVAVKVRPKVAPLPKPQVRGKSVAEAMAACGAAERDVTVAERGVYSGLLAEVSVFGVDEDGKSRDKLALSFDENGTGDMQIEDDDGISYLERVDAGMGRAVAGFAERMKRKGWTVQVFFRFHDRIYSDAARLSAARTELGIEDGTPPQWQAGCEEQQVMRITPGKDTGMKVVLSRGMRRV